MAWVTVYIRGKNGFQDAVLSKLKGPWLLGTPEAVGDLVMFWLPDTANVKALKLAIGRKLILKYRLHFITNLDIHLRLLKQPSTELTISENEMVSKMVRLDNAVRALQPKLEDEGATL